VEAADLVGAWRLIAYERDVDGQLVTDPSRAREGRILYLPGGQMAVVTARAGRPRLSGDDIGTSPVEERAATVEDSNAYTGTYEVQGNQVIHHVEVSLFPNWANTDQRRDATLEGNRLTLSSSRTTNDGRKRTARLIWERV
jgi:hypothetical protein